MELAGFSRAGVPGEYSPTVVFGTYETDVHNNTTYTTVISTTVTILEAGESLILVGSLVARQDFSGGSPFLRFTVDGVAYGGVVKTVGIGGAKANVRQVRVIEGLAPGPHTITLDWKNGQSSFLDPASVPSQEHVVLLCQRSRVVSGKEMDGFVQAGWPMIYTCPTVYQILSTSKTSTSTTITDDLFTDINVLSRYSQSALLIRFSVSGLNNDSVNEKDNKFTIFVDGSLICGTGNTTGFAQGASNANAICVIPVQAGNHTVSVKWAGGSSPGTTIDPNTDGLHASIQIEEVFCEDVNGVLPDIEGFAALNFASKFIPRVGYASLKTDLTGLTGQITLLEKQFYVSGDNSAVTVEFTASLVSNTVDPVFQIYVDGVAIRGCTETATNGFMQCCSVETAVNLPQGMHYIQLRMIGVANLTPATNPSFSHANMVIREVAKL